MNKKNTNPTLVNGAAANVPPRKRRMRKAAVPFARAVPTCKTLKEMMNTKYNLGSVLLTAYGVTEEGYKEDRSATILESGFI
jgi:hypothetical protein